MISEKKIYTPPKINRVRLIVKEAVLGTCHASPVLTPKLIEGCEVIIDQCWYPPGYSPEP